MKYKLKMSEWNEIFGVPKSVVDKHINLVNFNQLKVLLWALKNNSDLNLERISGELDIDISEVENAIKYWSESKILNIDEVEVPDNSTSIDTKRTIDTNITTKVENKPQIHRKKLEDSSYMADRINNSEQISSLMQEAQFILKTTISHNMISTLISLHDDDGLPIDVILMLLQYVADKGKANTRYIEKVGRSWAENGIDSIEKVENRIRELKDMNSAWHKFAKIIGVERSPTDKEQECTNKWFNEWNYSEELIKEAYERCIEFKGKYVLKYIDTIIRNWKESHIFNISQAKNDKKYGNNSKKITKNPSYDISEYENYSIFDGM